MVTPDQLRDLGDLAGLSLFIGISLLIAIGAVRGWWVPGWIYREAAAQRERLTDVVEKLTNELRRSNDERSSSD